MHAGSVGGSCIEGRTKDGLSASSAIRGRFPFTVVNYFTVVKRVKKIKRKTHICVGVKKGCNEELD